MSRLRIFRWWVGTDNRTCPWGIAVHTRIAFLRLCINGCRCCGGRTAKAANSCLPLVFTIGAANRTLVLGHCNGWITDVS